MTRPKLINDLKGMASEVNEFHPLLEKIFREMSSVKSVQYNHGTHEMGADFILSRHDEDFSEPEQIGVIVKIGKITQQHQDVDIQIEECAVKRIAIQGQPKEIYLSEIWVIVNGAISNGAQKKIHEKYKARNIKFIDLDLLADWVTKYAPNFGMKLSLEEGDYLENELNRAIERDTRTSLLPVNIDQFNIEQQIVEIHEESYESNGKQKKRNQPKKINIYSELSKSKIMTIEAPMGGGKSKLLNNIVRHYTDPNMYDSTSYLPIYFRCIEIFNMEFNTEEELIAELNSLTKLTENESRIYLLLVDGLDEIKLDDSQRSKLKSFTNIVYSSNRIKIVLTSRNIRDNELESQLFKISSRLEIKPLTTNLILKFILKICGKLNIEKHLIEDLKSSDLFHSLPKTPIAALILSRILTERTEDLPSNLTELYSQYAELALGRWDDQNGLKFLMHYEALESILAELAEYMLENSIPALSRPDTENLFQQYLKSRNFKIGAEELLDNALNRSDILIYDSRSNTISFKHKSFAEFFYAKKLLQSTDIKLDPSIFEPYKINCYYFLAGLKKDCPDLINSLINMKMPDLRARFMRMYGLGNILLAAYKTPYEVITAGLKISFEETATIYLEVQNQKANSPLAKFPPMTLLAFLRVLMQEFYSYENFESGLKDIIMDLRTDPEQSENTAYTLFFLDLALKDLNGSNIFIDLIESYSEKLPLPIQLAIGHETASFHDAPAPIKKMEKKLRKARRASNSFDASVMNLYEQAIDGSHRILRKT